MVGTPQQMQPPPEQPPPPGPPLGAPAVLPPLLAVQGLWKYYREVAAVQGVTLSVGSGEIVGLVGPNGAGKTTILRCICGILRPTAGAIFCGGYDLASQAGEAKRQVSLVPETPDLYQLLTVTEHLRFIHLAFDERGDFGPRAEALMQRLRLTDRRDSLVATLSKGMRQKLAVACAFMHSSRILLFDEPLIGIDPAGQREVKSMLEEAAAWGAAVVISSHLLDAVENLCPRVLILHHGQLLAEGTLDELRQRARMGTDTSLEDVFLSLTEAGAKVVSQ